MTQDSQLDRELPSDVACERTLLGAVLKNNDAWEQVCQLAKEDWSLESHQRIRQAMKRLKDAGSGIDELTLGDELRRRNELESVGGLSYLMDLQEGVYRNIALDDHLRIVRNKSVLRKLMATCTEAINRAADQSETGLELTAGLMNQLEKIAAPGQSSKNAGIETFFMDALEKANERYRTKVAPRIPTGNAWLDARIGGILHGYYSIVAARPKIGKSAFGDTAIAYNCIRGTRVVKISIEVDRDTSLYNLVPFVVDLPNIVCTRQELQSPAQNVLFNQGMSKILEEWPLRVYEGDIDCDEACWIIDRETKDGDEVLFVLDHFGLMVEAGKNNPSKIRESYVLDSGRLRRKIYRKRAAVMALFQLNEVAREYADKLPRPADIGESKKPLQDCAAMILLHRYHDKETLKVTKKANVSLALVRGGGAPGNIDGDFDTKRLEFVTQAELDNQGQDFYQ